MPDFDDRTKTAAPAAASLPRNLVVEITSRGTPRVLRLRDGVAHIGRDAGNEIVIDDPFLSRVHAEVRVSPRAVTIVDRGGKNGTVFQGARIRELPVRSDAIVTLGRHATVRVRVLDESQTALQPGAEFIGDSPAAERLRATVEKIAPSALTVLVEGETGSGKEVVARMLHARSQRWNQPFVVFDCASVSPQLIAAGLFGHTRDAFTGASGANEGSFRAAQGGTIFLDEIGELPLDLQPQLLRVLEAKQIKPVGADAYVPVDARVVAATNRDLQAEVDAGRFRKDLLFRLAVARVTVPPLRTRRADIPQLAEHFASALGAHLSPAVMQALSARSFQGNVRELRNVVERAVMLGGGPGASVNVLEDELVDVDGGDAPGEPPPPPPQPTFQDLKQQLIDEFEREYLVLLLRESGFNLSEASRRASVDRGHLRQLCRKHGIDVARLRGDRWPSS